MLTRQQIFDECAAHVIKQGTPSLNFSGTCMYDNLNGCHCAIGGPLAARGLLAPIMEKCSPSMVLDEAVFDITWSPTQTEGVLALSHALAIWGVEETDLRFVHQIQRAHDNAAREVAGTTFIYRFKATMRSIAGMNKLNPKVLD